MSRKEWFSLFILIAIAVFAVYRYQNRIFTETKTRIMMGTLIEVSLSSSKKNVSSLVDETFALISEYEKKLSYYNTEGILWKINHSEKDSFAIDEDLFELLTITEQFYHSTGRRYDVTIAPLIELWHNERTTLPPPDSIRAAQERVGFDRLRFSSDYLIKPTGMKINLGSIAKGYIVDKAVDFAQSQGIDFGHINAGGDIRLFGAIKREQRIGIRHPRELNRIIATLSVKNMAVVTSGDYERYFEVDGQRYHHIINPLTGYPVENIFSVTILAPTATIADVLSTAVFLMNPEDAIELIKSIEGAEGIIYYQEDEEILSLRTEGIKKYLAN